MKPGDIVLVHFPQTNLAPGKLRPALVVSDTPDDHDDVLLAMITSRLYQAVSDFDEIVSPQDSDYVMSRLKKPSVIRLSRLATVKRTSIEARLGRISSDRLSRSRKTLANWLLASSLS